jgi:catechol 2,3-dioxygenase-like lactoylglutathione lyase family enzyme
MRAQSSAAGRIAVAATSGESEKRRRRTMSEFPKMAFAHIGIYVIDAARMTEFYTRVLGFCVTDRARIRGADVVFLSRDPEEHHQIILVPGRNPEHASTVNQISFRVASFAELRRIHRGLVDEPAISALSPVNHGGSWSVYFADPEGNRIELFAQTPWYMPPVSIPLDLALSDEDVFRLTEAMVQATPGHMPRAAWQEQTRLRMIEEGTLEHRAPGAASTQSAPSEAAAGPSVPGVG